MAVSPINRQKIAAHRGLSGVCPENTMLAFEAARQASVQGLETDVCMLKDETLIIFHDKVQGRTVTGDKPVDEAVWADFADKDAGLWRGQDFAGQKVPRLAELLVWAARHSVSVNLEVKCHGGRQARTADRLAAALRHTSTDDIVISSFDLSVLQALRELMPEQRLASIHEEMPEDLHRLKDSLEVEAVHLDHQLITSPDDVAGFHQHGFAVRAWTVNEAPRADQLLRWGVDMVMSDYPERLLAAAGVSQSCG